MIHEPGEIRMKSGETVYIEGGAVVRGYIVAEDAAGIRIMGRGILDGGPHAVRRPGSDSVAFVHARRRMIDLLRCDGRADRRDYNFRQRDLDRGSPALRGTSASTT